MKTFPLQRSKRTPQVVRLLPNDVRPEIPIDSRTIALLAETCRKIEYDRNTEHVRFASKLDKALSVFSLDIRCVDNAQSACSQAFPRYVVEKVESIRRCSLVILIVGNQSAAEIGGKDFG
jgi:hypothetical protein